MVAQVTGVKQGASALSRFFALELLDNRYPPFHGLRVLAIVSVVQFHVTEVLGVYEKMLTRDWVASSMTVFFGMDLFFVLSGFLIGSILLRSLDDGNRTKMLRRFYLRRMFRTFPAYYVVLGTLILIKGLTPLQRHHLPFEIAYLTNFMPLSPKDVVMPWGWSLALEEQFYLIVPVLFFILAWIKSDRARIGLLVVLWASALGGRLYVLYRYSPWSDYDIWLAVYFRTFTRFDTLVAGILLAYANYRYKDPIARWLEHPFHRAQLSVIALSCLWVLIRPWMFGADHLQLVRMFAWGSITSVMYFCVALLLLNGAGWINRILSAHIFRRIATLGYGIYLVHFPLLNAVVAPVSRALNRHLPIVIVWPFAVALALVASLAASYALHLLVEKPAMRIRERVAG
jgi:peptidoglycan/LPS O-acetylase OafA/YrhL